MTKEPQIFKSKEVVFFVQDGNLETTDNLQMKINGLEDSHKLICNRKTDVLYYCAGRVTNPNETIKLELNEESFEYAKGLFERLCKKYHVDVDSVDFQAAFVEAFTLFKKITLGGIVQESAVNESSNLGYLLDKSFSVLQRAENMCTNFISNTMDRMTFVSQLNSLDGTKAPKYGNALSKLEEALDELIELCPVLFKAGQFGDDMWI